MWLRPETTLHLPRVLQVEELLADIFRKGARAVPLAFNSRAIRKLVRGSGPGSLIHAAPLALIQFATRRAQDEVEIDHWPWLARGFVYVLMFFAIASSTIGEVEFIYFQF